MVNSESEVLPATFAIPTESLAGEHPSKASSSKSSARSPSPCRRAQRQRPRVLLPRGSAVTGVSLDGRAPLPLERTYSRHYTPTTPRGPRRARNATAAASIGISPSLNKASVRSLPPLLPSPAEGPRILLSSREGARPPGFPTAATLLPPEKGRDLDAPTQPPRRPETGTDSDASAIPPLPACLPVVSPPSSDPSSACPALRRGCRRRTEACAGGRPDGLD